MGLLFGIIVLVVDVRKLGRTRCCGEAAVTYRLLDAIR
jgi:hypothetical protein